MPTFKEWKFITKEGKTISKTTRAALKTSNRIWRGSSYNTDTVEVYSVRQNTSNSEYHFLFADVGFQTEINSVKKAST
jgi:hypothetical protein